MKIIKPGHFYELAHLDGELTTSLQFVQRKPFHSPKEGTTNQEVVRALIDRVKVLEAETPWEGNSQILFHLRMVIALHEGRAVQRHIQKHGLEVEHFDLSSDGHWVIR